MSAWASASGMVHGTTAAATETANGPAKARAGRAEHARNQDRPTSGSYQRESTAMACGSASGHS